MSSLRQGFVRVHASRASQMRGCSSSGRGSGNVRAQTMSSGDRFRRGESEGQGQQESSRTRRGLQWAGEVVWWCGVVHCFTEYVLQPCAVSGPSMRPTIEHKSLLLIDKWYVQGRDSPLKMSQIVLVKSPINPGKTVLKRINGLPGDSIEVRPPAWDTHNSLGIEKRLVIVPEGHVWLEGDNKDNSKDSRYYGPVPEAMVQGVAFFRLWPSKEFGAIS